MVHLFLWTLLYAWTGAAVLASVVQLLGYLYTSICPGLYSKLNFSKKSMDIYYRYTIPKKR